MSLDRTVSSNRNPHATAAAVLALAALAGAQATERISLGAGGVQPNAHCRLPTISGDGRYVAYESDATNLAAIDNNGKPDVFVCDRELGTTTVLSEKWSGAGETGKGRANEPRISRDGRYVVFYSSSFDMVSPEPPNIGGYAWRKDVATGAIEIVSLRADGSPVQPTSFHFDYDVSASGRYVAFISSDPFVVAGDNNNNTDVFLRDCVAGTTTRVSLDSNGNEIVGNVSAVSLSSDGRYVAFLASAPTVPPADSQRHLFVKDRQTAAFSAIDVTSGGAIGDASPIDPKMSADGNSLVWKNVATNLPGAEILVADRGAGVILGVDVTSSGAAANGASMEPALCDDGRFLAFSTTATNFDLALTDWGVALRDRAAQTTVIESKSTSGVVANSGCFDTALSGDGRFLVFASTATNLVAGDTNGRFDIYLRDRAGTGVLEYCTAQPNSLGCSAHVAATGTASASAGSGFVISCASVLNQKPGVLFYGTTGSQIAPYLGGYLCMKLPIVRTSVQLSGGSSSGSDCTGSYAYDFNARIASGVDPDLFAGQEVAAQYWSRDPNAASTTNLSDAVLFTIGP